MTHSTAPGDQPPANGVGGSSSQSDIDVPALMEQIRAELAERRVKVEPASGELARAGGMPFVQQPPNAAEIMERVRAEIRRRRHPEPPAEQIAALAVGETIVVPPGEPLPRWRPSAARLPDQEQYALADFLRFDDVDFVEVAYEKLLRRTADPEGRQGYLDGLRTGTVSKVEILGLIRFSSEGRQHSVHVDGLLLPYKLHCWRHVRGIGWFLGMAMGLARLPRLAWRLQGMEASAARETQELGRLLDRVDASVERKFAGADSVMKALHTKLDALRADLTRSDTSSVESLRAIVASLESVRDRVRSQKDGLRASNAERAEQHQVVQEQLAAQREASSHIEDGLRASNAERAEQHQAVREQLAAQQETSSRIEDALLASNAERAEQHQAVQEQLAAQREASARIEESVRSQDSEHQRQFKVIADHHAVQNAAVARLDEQAQGDQRSLHAMLERLTVFLDASARQKAGRKGKPGATNVAPDPQYAAFEEAFRGDREQIKLRAAHYLQTLAAADVRPANHGVVLDLGSGRGEWLEVLAEHDYRGRGVDTDKGMLRASTERGHDVVEADALDYLRAQKDGAFAAITSMHMVEHIPHATLLQLLDEARRVLRPGGVLILETPNPENVLVGSCMFYMDPTHLHPIPPPLLQWTVKSRGYEQVVIERLSEHRGSPGLQPVSDNVPGAAQINQMVEWFTAPPDYAVVARKSLT